MRAGVLAVLVVLLSAGCVSRSNEDGHNLPVQDADSVEELAVSAPGIAAKPRGVRAREVGDDGDLRGPHFSLDIDWVATGPMIRDDVTPGVLDLTPRRAAEGQELVLVAVTGEHPDGQFPPGAAPAAKPRAELIVDGEKTPLPTLPLPAQDGPVPVPADGVLVVASRATGCAGGAGRHRRGRDPAGRPADP